MKILRAFAIGIVLIGFTGIVVAAEEAASAPTASPAVTPAERLFKTAAEWKSLAAKKRLAAEAEEDEEKKKAKLEAAAEIEEFAIRTQRQAETESVLEKDMGVLEARAFEGVAARKFLKSQEELDAVRSEIQALGTSTDARNKAKAVEFQQKIKTLESNRASLDAARQKTAAAQEKALKKAAKARK